MTDKTVLSIQSHVTHGYVGNTAASFPLHLHGFDINAINTVNLSNHSGYPVIRGHRMTLAEFEDVLSGLRANGFLELYPFILTGYVNNVDIIQNIRGLVAEIQQARASKGLGPALFICDPVMGDDGKMYCKPEVVDAYRELLAVADISTPNYYEANLLTGVEVTDIDSAIRAADWLHARGTSKVVIKSFRKADENVMHYLASEVVPDAGSADARTVKRYSGVLPYHEGRYTGTGDVFAASLLGFLVQLSFPDAVAKAMGVLQDLITLTRRAGGGSSASINARELRIIPFASSLLSPTTVITYEQL